MHHCHAYGLQILVVQQPQVLLRGDPEGVKRLGEMHHGKAFQAGEQIP